MYAPAKNVHRHVPRSYFNSTGPCSLISIGEPSTWRMVLVELKTKRCTFTDCPTINTCSGIKRRRHGKVNRRTRHMTCQCALIGRKAREIHPLDVYVVTRWSILPFARDSVSTFFFFLSIPVSRSPLYSQLYFDPDSCGCPNAEGVSDLQIRVIRMIVLFRATCGN